MAALGWIRLQQTRYIEAEGLIRQALDVQQKASPETWQRYNIESLLGTSLERQGKYGAAEPLLIAGYQGLLQRTASIPLGERSALDEARANLARLYIDAGKPDKAAERMQRSKLNLASASKQ